MKIKLKSKPFGILLIGMAIALLGALAKIMKETFAENILIIALIVEGIGIIIFFRWYFRIREKEKNFVD